VLNTFDSNSSQAGSLRCPDRFVPTRRTALDVATQLFRANKDPATLTTDEKLLRHKDASWDSFNPRRRVTSPIPRANRLERRNVSRTRSGGGGGSVLTFRQDLPGPNGERQVSLILSVWSRK
jgi:meiosis-specific APC/C activator protein AMA1